MRRHRHIRSIARILVWACVAATARATAQAPTAAAGAKTWLGRGAEIEAFIRDAEVIGKPESIPVGVTSPKKVALAPGGPVEFVAWKPIRPGTYNGFRESYKAEVAAYEMDKLLGLDMVPPTVERRIGDDVGAAIMWVAGTRTFADLKGAITPPPSEAARWDRQLSRAMMFDNLIGNEDPNLGNWLKDDQWNLILIDHSRALSTGRDLTHKMNTIDRGLWDRMRALDEPALSDAVGRWLSTSEIRAILRRRDKMAEAIAKLVKEKGEASVFLLPR